MEMEMAWGTWEELVLGGAVLRHGVAEWNAVAAELRSRTRLPHLFSPQECEAKFAQVQERFSGSETWFEELRKQRVAELKRELEKSENSIGSLQSKLATLSSSGTDTTSHNEVIGHDIISSSCKECQSNSDSVSNSKKCEDIRWNWGLQKKRGRRERKRECAMDCETNSSSHTEKQGSTEVGVTESVSAVSASVKSEDGNVRREDLEVIFKTILENKECSVFRKRLESQKKNRYKKMIRQHVDLQIVSSKLSKGLISSPKELLRDLLLLANNALVFYPKNSPEHNSAIILRNLSSKTLKRILSSSSSLDPNSSSNEEIEPEKPQIKEDLGSVEEENKEVGKEVRSKNKELDKEVPSKNKELVKEVPSKNKELDKAVPSKNKEVDKGVPSKNKELDKEVPSKNKELEKAVPSKNKELDKGVPSKNKDLDKGVPSKNKELEKAVPSKNKELEKAVPSKNKVLDKAAPSKNKVLDKAVPSKNKVLNKVVPSKNVVVDKAVTSKSKVFDKPVPRQNKVSDKVVPSRNKELDKEMTRKPPNNASGKIVKKNTVDRPTRGGGGQKGPANRGKKRARR